MRYSINIAIMMQAQQAKGVYNLAESELISSAIRAIKNNSTDATAAKETITPKAKVEKK